MVYHPPSELRSSITKMFDENKTNIFQLISLSFQIADSQLFYQFTFMNSDILAEPLLAQNFDEQKKQVVNLDVTFDEISLEAYSFFKKLYFFCSIISASLLLQEITSLKIFRQVVIFTLVIFPLTYASYLKDFYDGSILAEIFLVLLALTGMLAILNIHSYSVLGIAFFCVFLVMFLNKNNVPLRRQEGSFNVFILLVVFIALVMALIDDQILVISWSLLLIPLQVGMLISICFILFLMKRRYNFEMVRSDYPFRHLLKFLPTALFLPSILLFLSKIYSGSSLFLILVKMNTVKDFFITLLIIFLTKEIIFFSQFSFYSYSEVSYRVHQRQFSKFFNAKTCNRKVKWYDEECLLCSQKTVIIYFDCGHLVLCKRCFKKLKKNKECLICRQLVYNVEQILFIPKNIKYGYQGKIFIGKELQRNMFLI